MGRLRRAGERGGDRPWRTGREPPYSGTVPELPEVEITARLLDRALAGAEIESALAPGINALKTIDPPLSALAGRRIERVRRRGKHLIVEVSDGMALLIHLMSAGRLQLYDRRAGPRDRTSRLLVRLRDGRELRLREFGSKQAAWVKLMPARELEHDAALSALGPEAWPDPLPLEQLLDTPRPLHSLLRDQHTIAGIGRSWVDEILWSAMLSPFKRGEDLETRSASVSHTRSPPLSDARSHTTSRPCSCRSRTSCRCPCRCTATRASSARAARPRCDRCTSRTT